ncbi:hypothetical protein GMMP15_1930002 [Candidatus Magnetomoraceae bacterium gMMP-15]
MENRAFCLKNAEDNLSKIIKKTISPETKDIIDRLLLERISLAGIAKFVEVSERWLQNYVNKKYDSTPKKVDIKKKLKGRLTAAFFCRSVYRFVIAEFSI